MEKELYTDILAVMAKIQTEYPELIKYLPEMPIRNTGRHPTRGVTIQGLTEYYQSLASLVTKYAGDHSVF